MKQDSVTMGLYTRLCTGSFLTCGQHAGLQQLRTGVMLRNAAYAAAFNHPEVIEYVVVLPLHASSLQSMMTGHNHFCFLQSSVIQAHLTELSCFVVQAHRTEISCFIAKIKQINILM